MKDSSKKHILLVEDEMLIATGEKIQLEEAGYHVVLCQNGEKAIEILQAGTSSVDLVLMDINLGRGMSGTEAAEVILEFIQIPIIFLSSHTEKEVVEKTEAITNYGYVVKNSGITVLDASIKMAFRLFDAYTNIQSQQKAMENSNNNLIRSENALKKSETAVRNKLHAIMEPDGDIGTLELSDIIDSENIQSLMEDFYDLTGILGAILDIKGNILVATGWQDICTKFHRCNPVSAANCKESDTQLTNGVGEGTYKLYRCKNNMWDMVTPLFIDNHHIGNIFIGQFIFEDEKPDIEIFRKQAHTYGFDEEKYLEALSKVPHFSKETVNTGMAFYSKVAKMISTLSFSSIKLSRTIAERKKAEDEVRVLLKEKELILKEVHHRIKNNLGIVNSLLAMQMDNEDDPKVKNILSDATGRIDSMKVLYDKLHQSEGFQKIGLNEYVNQLVTEIMQIFPGSLIPELRIDIEDVLLDAKMMSRIGIILNEMITNTMKYAFQGRDKGSIAIESRIDTGKIRFRYADDGIGIPVNVSFESSSGFGMQLIKLLVEEMMGTIRIERTDRVWYVMEFDAEGFSHASDQAM